MMSLVGQTIKVRPQSFKVGPNSDGGTGNVIKDNGVTIDIKWVIGGGTEKAVAKERIESLNVLFTLARRRNDDETDRPSLLAPTHQPTALRTPVRTLPPIPPITPTTLSSLILESKCWCKHDSVPNQLLVVLREGHNNKTKGWLRKEEGEYDKYQKDDKSKGVKKGQMKKQLSTVEHNKLVLIMMEIERIKAVVGGEWDRKDHPISDVAYAYGVSHRSVRDCVKNQLKKPRGSNRKQRSDKGHTIINNQAMRDRLYTGLNHFKKACRKSCPGENFRNSELNEAYNNLSAERKNWHSMHADMEKQIASDFVGQIKNVMQMTNGSISWERMACYIAGGEDRPQPICKETLRKHVMGTEGFRYYATQTLPQVTTERTKLQRQKWSIGFHIFWEGAKMVAPKVQVLYFHIDEKWFYSLVVRMNQKSVPEYGVKCVWNHIHHKNNIEKILCICAMAFLPKDNDMRKDGRAVKICMTRAGGMTKAQKNTYKRVYNADGSYTYPAREDNILRVKGNEYYEAWEITGSKESDSQGNKKFAITKWIQQHFIGALNNICQRIEHETGKKVHVRGQWDNASPHTEKNVLALIGNLFEQKGWVWTMQPPNSPLCNIMDAAIFPALAKLVSGYQGLHNGGRYLKGELLYEYVQKAWDNYPVEKIARAFVHHAQVAAAIHHCNGGDDFVKQQNGLHCNVRKVCTLDFGDGEEGGQFDFETAGNQSTRKPVGVIVNEEAVGSVDLDGNDDKKMKYDTPDMSQYNIGDYLNFDELELIAATEMDDDFFNNSSEEVKERYSKYVEAWHSHMDSVPALPLYVPQTN